jgi:glycosyltransferase involved in cell wall biosynthesis
MLEAVRRQLGGVEDGGQVEIVLVDSGSTDATRDIAAGSFGATVVTTVVTLPPMSFTYGYALNTGVAAATGEIVVPLSAHAVPADRLWLAKLVTPFVVDPQLAGCFGRELQWPDATVSDHVIATMRQTNADWPRYVPAGDLSKFSNTNEAVRRSAALAVPFEEEVPGGEDTLWASAVLQLGWRVLYTPVAQVWHGHHSSSSELVRLAAQSLSTRAMARE